MRNWNSLLLYLLHLGSAWIYNTYEELKPKLIHAHIQSVWIYNTYEELKPGRCNYSWPSKRRIYNTYEELKLRHTLFH